MRIPRFWTFVDTYVATGFEKHVRMHLPWYDLATDAVAHLVRNYLPEDGLVYDIGASTGNIGRAIEDVLKARRGKFIGVESSPAMVHQYRAPGMLILDDAHLVEYQEFDVAVCMLVLMFLPPQRRGELMEHLRRKVKPGGAIIVVDKFECDQGYHQTVLSRLCWRMKKAAGVEPEEVLSKEISLMGAQRPLGVGFIKRHLRDAQEFFRYGEFAGYLITRNE